jgi:hypothetical protein
VFNQKLIFLAGIPSSGKSHFGEWLKINHDFIHIDAEKNDLDRLDIHELWNASISQNDASSFVAKLLEFKKSVILNWGFPKHCLPFVTKLKQSGFNMVWFDADIKQARIKHENCGKSLQDFDKQIPGIQSIQDCINKSFTIIKTLDTEGNYLSPESTYKQTIAK